MQRFNVMKSVSAIRRPVTKAQLGFTLLEVMISTVLSSVVLMLVYSSVDVAARLSHAGTQSTLNDSVARTVLFRIHDDLKTMSEGSEQYLSLTANDSFASDRFRQFMVQGGPAGSEIRVSSEFLLLQSIWSAPPALPHQDDLKDASWGAKYVAYFVSAEGFENELGDHLRRLGLSLQAPEMDFPPQPGFHRCLLIRDSSEGALRLIGVDPMFERPELDSVTFRVFDGSNWLVPDASNSDDAVAIESSIQLEKETGSIPSGKFGSQRSNQSKRGGYSLVTTVHHSNRVQDSARVQR